MENEELDLAEMFGFGSQADTVGGLLEFNFDDLAENRGFQNIPTGQYLLTISAEQIPCLAKITRQDAETGEPTVSIGGVFRGTIAGVLAMDTTECPDPDAEAQKWLGKEYREASLSFRRETFKADYQSWAGKMKTLFVDGGLLDRANPPKSADEMFKAFAGQSIVVTINTKPSRKNPDRVYSNIDLRKGRVGNAQEVMAQIEAANVAAAQAQTPVAG